MFYTNDRDSFEHCLRENDFVPADERQKIKKKELSKVKHRKCKLILKTDQPTGYWLMDFLKANIAMLKAKKSAKIKTLKAKDNYA